MSRQTLLNILHNAVQQGGANAQMELYLRGAMQQESGGDIYAGRGKHKAQGLFQFMPDTWRNYGGGDIYDAATQCRNAVRMTRDSDRLLHQPAFVEARQKLHLPAEPNAGEYYIMHFLGQGGATKVLTADPSTPISQLVSHGAIVANPITYRGKKFAQFTAGDLRHWAEAKMNVDLSARLVYQETENHTPEQQNSEAEERRRILLEGGMDKDQVDKLVKSGDILGLMFFVILSKMFGNLGPIHGVQTAQANAPQVLATTPDASTAPTNPLAAPSTTAPVPPAVAPPTVPATPPGLLSIQLPTNLPNLLLTQASPAFSLQPLVFKPATAPALPAKLTLA